MNYTVLINRLMMLPFNRVIELFSDYEKNIGFKTFAEQQRVLDLLFERKDIENRLKDEVVQEAAFAYTIMSLGKNFMAKEAFNSMKKYPMVVWVEAVQVLDADGIMKLLNNFHRELTPSLIGMFIINLPVSMQLEAIDKYYKEFEINDCTFENFYYSVSDQARIKLNEYFEELDKNDFLLELNDMDEDMALKKLLEKKNVVLRLDADDFITFILLKFTKVSSFNTVIDNFKELIENCSEEKFELFFTRYKYLKSNEYEYDFDDYYDLNIKKDNVDDLELFNLFKNKFSLLGIERTLSLFDIKRNYEINEFSVEVILTFLEQVYEDSNIASYINEDTICEIIKKFVDKCRKRDYTKEEFEVLINRIGDKTKLIHDDFIEAIVACGKLLEKRVIDDRDSLFILLREKFSADLIGRSKKDGTYNGNLSLNGIFYRLAKGNMPFEKVYMTKSLKGLIYLTKCGSLINNADYITNFLTDEQLAKLNISPLIKWKKNIKRTNTRADSLSFLERMGLQLLCYFGKDKGKYLLESEMQGNLMENLFDGLNYADVSINEDGTPDVNMELIDFLFGHGRLTEPNSVINTMIRGDIPEFKEYFTEFCREYFNLKKACNGILSVKRIVRHFSDIPLPIELKPDEVLFKKALGEMKTIDEERLKEAIELCKDAREREYSTIPKVAGEMGNFRYEILDLDDSLAIAVGELSHCCFVVRGISYSALKQAMQSKNGRVFVVYYKDSFFAQSWVWRNGDVICFDSVEAGCPVHGVLNDENKLVDVYKNAASSMLSISREMEDDIQKVKVITVGKSDYTFEGLERFEGDVPRPLEKDVYVYDSSEQSILAGTVPEKIRYGEVGAQYFDPVLKPHIYNDTSKANVDELDEVALNINALRYRVHGIEDAIDFSNYLKVYSGDGWYILEDFDGNIESGIVKHSDTIEEELKKYMDNVTGCNKEKFKTYRK